MKFLISILFCLMLSTDVLASTFYAGYSHTMHLSSNYLYDYHPYMGYENDKVGAMWYLNSFERGAVALYVINAQPIADKLSLKLQSGITTGYKPKIRYGGRHREVSGNVFLTPNIMVFVMPAIEYQLPGLTTHLGIVGNAISFGFKINIK